MTEQDFIPETREDAFELFRREAEVNRFTCSTCLHRRLRNTDDGMTFCTIIKEYLPLNWFCADWRDVE